MTYAYLDSRKRKQTGTLDDRQAAYLERLFGAK